MKKYLKHIVTALTGVLLLSACKKDNAEKKEGFDVHNPEGYSVFTRYKPGNINLFYFMPGKMAQIYQPSGGESIVLPYTVIDNNTMDFAGATGHSFRMTVNDNKVTGLFFTGAASSYGFYGYSLIKKPVTDQLAGKTFKGTWLDGEGNVKGYGTYHFDAATLKISGTEGQSEATAQAFTPYDYTPFGNIGALARWQIFVLVDGKLEAQRNATYGTFIQE